MGCFEELMVLKANGGWNGNSMDNIYRNISNYDSGITVVENIEETSLAPITEEIYLLKKIKQMIGYVRMFFNKTEISKPVKEISQQEAMKEFLNSVYERLDGKVARKILGIEDSKFSRSNKPRELMPVK